MKKIIVFIFLFVTVTVSAQNKITEDTIPKPAITAKGTPDGEKAEMKIGKDGGSLLSSDGKVAYQNLNNINLSKVDILHHKIKQSL